MKNNIEEDIKNAEHFIKSIKTDKEYKEENGWHGYYNKEIVELARMLEHILSDYKRVQKELEELKDTNCLVKRYFKLKDTNTYLQKENEKLKKSKIKYEKVRDIQEKNKNIVDNNYIPNQKIKDKIEELKKQYNVREIDFIKTTQDIRKIIIQSLEELIEGKK